MPLSMGEHIFRRCCAGDKQDVLDVLRPPTRIFLDQKLSLAQTCQQHRGLFFFSESSPEDMFLLERGKEREGEREREKKKHP